MQEYAITVIGPDRPGIIADVSAVLAGSGLNLTDSTMTLLRGHFAMTLICAGDAAPGDVDAALRPLGDELVVTVREVSTEDIAEPGGGHYVLRLHGADRLGIVAAVMGVVHTMESVGIPPAELGKLIAAALVGTFLGILLSYGFVAPLATLLEHKLHEQTKMLQCIKVTLLASLNGYAPQVAVEFGRKVLYSTERPSFTELESEVKQRKGK